MCFINENEIICGDGDCFHLTSPKPRGAATLHSCCKTYRAVARNLIYFVCDDRVEFDYDDTRAVTSASPPDMIVVAISIDAQQVEIVWYCGWREASSRVLRGRTEQSLAGRVLWSRLAFFLQGLKTRSLRFDESPVISKNPALGL